MSRERACCSRAAAGPPRANCSPRWMYASKSLWDINTNSCCCQGGEPAGPLWQPPPCSEARRSLQHMLTVQNSPKQPQSWDSQHLRPHRPACPSLCLLAHSCLLPEPDSDFLPAFPSLVLSLIQRARAPPPPRTHIHTPTIWWFATEGSSEGNFKAKQGNLAVGSTLLSTGCGVRGCLFLGSWHLQQARKAFFALAGGLQH